MLINISALLVDLIKYSIAALFSVFVLGAYLLALFKHRLLDSRVEQLRRLGWLIVGVAFLLIGLALLMLIFLQIDQGEAARISRDGSRVSVNFSVAPIMFVFIVGLEMFFSGLFAFIGVGYLKLFRAMGRQAK